jgi:hypothetical protein
LPCLSEVPSASTGQGRLVLHSRLNPRSKQDQLIRRRPRLRRRIDEQQDLVQQIRRARLGLPSARQREQTHPVEQKLF